MESRGFFVLPASLCGGGVAVQFSSLVSPGLPSGPFRSHA